MTDDNVVSLGDKLRKKALHDELLRRLNRTISEMRKTGASIQAIVDVLNEAAEDLKKHGRGDKPN